MKNTFLIAFSFIISIFYSETGVAAARYSHPSEKGEFGEHQKAEPAKSLSPVSTVLVPHGEGSSHSRSPLADSEGSSLITGSPTSTSMRFNEETLYCIADGEWTEKYPSMNEISEIPPALMEKVGDTYMGQFYTVLARHFFAMNSLEEVAAAYHALLKLKTVDYHQQKFLEEAGIDNTMSVEQIERVLREGTRAS